MVCLLSYQFFYTNKNSLIFIQWSVSDACMFNVYQADNLKKYKQKEDDLVDNCSITPQDLQTKIPNKFALKVDIEKHIEWYKNNCSVWNSAPEEKFAKVARID